MTMDERIKRIKNDIEENISSENETLGELILQLPRTFKES
jgi:uncharacterized protein YecE (DUF72 family)